MTSTVYCVKYKEERPAMAKQPYPGELGLKVQNEVSQDAWKDWLRHQTMLINEYRLNPIDPKARQFLEKEMSAYFFGDGSERPPGYQD